MTKFLFKVSKFILVISLLAVLINWPGLNELPVAEAASGNLIKENSFEGNIFSNWGLWQNPDSTRQYKFYRSYDAPFGYGSYSAAIDASGAVAEPFAAVFSTINANKFPVESGKTYYLFFYAKATTPLDTLAYMQKAADYSAISQIIGRRLSTSWQRYTLTFTAEATTDAYLAFTLGDMPSGSSFYMDGVQLFEASQAVLTKEIKGFIGDQNKSIKISNINNFSLNDFAIELPYYNNLNGQLVAKKFNAKSLTSGGLVFDMPAQTFSGIGRVFVNDMYIGFFDYKVMPKINEFFPSLVRANENLVIYGSGFNPSPNATFAVLSATDLAGKIRQIWTKPFVMDSNLSQITVRLPYGIVAGSLFVQTSFFGINQTEIVTKTNSIRYKVKPVIYAGGIEWKDRGYEQVGDRVLIHGQGLSYSPTVNFYDGSGKKVDSKKGKLIELEGHEIIEVNTSSKNNNLFITAMAGGVESDRGSALVYTAKPKLASIRTKYSRPLYNSSEKISAAKVGDEITLTGMGFTPSLNGFTAVEFEGQSRRIIVPVADSAIDKAGKSLKVIVPSGAQNGYLSVLANGESSNLLSLEIIPTIVSIEPNPFVPGQTMSIMAEGVGKEMSLTRVYFKTGSVSEIAVTPNSVSQSGTYSRINLIAPLAVSNGNTTVSVQYDRWRDNGKVPLAVAPTITGASIDLDTKILVIRGYGFSDKANENQITYRYADQDQTVINPKVRVLGVYQTDEGQEIRVQILDDYYFGYVYVTVNGYSSNEANFGPAAVRKVTRRVEYVESAGQVMGVIYISGYNFGTQGGVKVGDHWADVHYRSEFFIIAVIDQAYVYDNPIIVARE